jgi:RNA polymerase sigma factor (sigma-70 family)
MGLLMKALKLPHEDNQMKTLYTRMKDGGQKVHIEPDLLKLEDGRQFSSARQLLLAVTGKDRHWTFDRYFRQGQYAPGRDLQSYMEATPDMLEWQKPRAPGIDLENRSGEVAKLLFAGFGSWIFSAGYDPDDVFQEVCKGIIARNRGKCPWDPNKSSFGHYVHMVCKGIIANFHRKKKRIREVEQIGMFQVDAEQPRDVGSVPQEDKKSSVQMETEVQEVQDDLVNFIQAQTGAKRAPVESQVAIGAIPLLRLGYTRAEIAEELGITLATASRGLAYLRAQAKKWKECLE